MKIRKAEASLDNGKNQVQSDNCAKPNPNTSPTSLNPAQSCGRSGINMFEVFLKIHLFAGRKWEFVM